MWSNQYGAHGARQRHRTSLLQDLLEPQRLIAGTILQEDKVCIK